MAKRRNQKKEKALRNLAYARKFRKRTNTGRMGGRGRRTGGGAAEDDMEQDTRSSAEEPAE